ncbi:hypothetical protein ABZZ36_36390 [Actinacidiphila glaucinigra]|uniref:hypothetical protein n=1 Tax=Actinacidiphila glaucinigra TaxID=235986 RepID=UPI0033AFEAD5
MTSTDLIGSAALPEHLVIAGGGCPGPGGRRRADRRPPWPPAARAPAARGLGLEAAAVRTAENGAVVVDGHPRAGRPRVFGLGDVNGARSSPASPSTEALNDGLATVVRSDD